MRDPVALMADIVYILNHEIYTPFPPYRGKGPQHGRHA